LEAIRVSSPLCQNLKFILIGDGEFMPQFSRLVSEYSLEGVVEIKGWVPVEELPQHLAGVDLGVIGNRKYQ